MAGERKRSVIGIASFVTGIFGVFSIWKPPEPESIYLKFGLILGSLAIIFGAIALGKDKEDKGGRYGLLLGIIAVISGLVLSPLFLVGYLL